MHFGPHNQSFGWAMAHPAHAAAPPMASSLYCVYVSSCSTCCRIVCMKEDLNIGLLVGGEEGVLMSFEDGSVVHLAAT